MRMTPLAHLFEYLVLSRTVWEELGGVVLQDRVCHQGQTKVSKDFASVLSASCFQWRPELSLPHLYFTFTSHSGTSAFWNHKHYLLAFFCKLLWSQCLITHRKVTETPVCVVLGIESQGLVHEKQACYQRVTSLVHRTYCFRLGFSVNAAKNTS